MAKPGLFQNFFSKIGALIQWITETAQAVLDDLQTILTIKSIIEDDFAQIITDLKTLTDTQQDFADRVKNLKKHVIRADVIFEFIDEIRTGKLRQFCVDELNTLRGGLSQSINEALNAGTAIGVIKTGQLGSSNPVVKFIQTLVGVFTQIARFVHALNVLKDVVQQITDKLTQFESVILQQKNPRKVSHSKFRERIGKLHASA